jgi:hypothetical protein
MAEAASVPRELPHWGIAPHASSQIPALVGNI